MEPDSDKTHWKSINKIASLGTGAHLLAQDHFPNDGPERRLLLEINDTLSQLWSVHFGLEATIKQVDEMRRLSLDEQLDVMEMSLMLEGMAFDCDIGSAKQETLARAAKLMLGWYKLSRDFDDLRSVSESFRHAVRHHRLNA